MAGDEHYYPRCLFLQKVGSEVMNAYDLLDETGKQILEAYDSSMLCSDEERL